MLRPIIALPTISDVYEAHTFAGWHAGATMARSVAATAAYSHPFPERTIAAHVRFARECAAMCRAILAYAAVNGPVRDDVFFLPSVTIHRPTVR